MGAMTPGNGGTSNSTAELVPFVPNLLRFDENQENLSTFWSREIQGVTLLADISGFTPLAESLGDQGARGAEQLAQILDRTFGAMVDVIVGWGGDILRFAGDAPIAIWSVDPQGGGDVDVLKLVEHAVGCARDLVAILEPSEGVPGVALSMSVGIAAGRMEATSVGGRQERWELVVSGEPFDKMSRAERLANPGEIVLAESAALLWKRPSRAMTEVSGGFCRVATTDSGERAVSPALDHRAVDPRPAEDWRAFVPRFLVGRAGAVEGDWLAEYRRVTVLFASLEGMEPGVEVARKVLHQAFGEIQRAIYDVGGSVNQFLVDDKGTTLLALWGVPGCTHEDDPRRAVEAALSIHRQLERFKLRVSVGLSTGRVFCGRRGSRRRCEYAVIGRTVNQAARLMAVAADGVLCDPSTKSLVGTMIRFDSLPSVVLKGVSEPLPVFRPRGVVSLREHRRITGEFRALQTVVGREGTRRQLRELVQETVAGEGAVLVLSGAVGSGKSELLDSTERYCGLEKVRVLRCSGDSIRQATAYKAWREVLYTEQELPEGSSHPDRLERERRVCARLTLHEIDIALAPLLNSVIDLAIPESDLTEQMPPEVRGEALRELMTRWVTLELGNQPCVVLVDDGQWVDSASWNLGLALQSQLANLSLLVAVRTEGVEPLVKELDPESFREITLEPMSQKSLLHLVCNQLRVSRLPRDLEDLLADRAAGNPLFARELARSLLDRGLIEVGNGVCRLTGAVGSLDGVDFPDTIHGLLGSRIDRLKSEDQMTLKVASVVGGGFELETLVQAHPEGHSENSVRAHLESLTHQQLILPLSETSSPQYAFAQLATRDVAYGLLLPAQREQLHRSVAEWFEAQPAVDQPLAVLAHHWTEAKDRNKTLEFLERAGNHAIRSGAEREAVGFFSRVLTLYDPSSKNPVDRLKRIRCQRELGHAHFILGQMEQGEVQLGQALALVGRPLPVTSSQWARRLLRESVVQVWRLLVPWLRGSKRTNPRNLEAARLMDLVGRMSFYRDDPLGFVTASLNSVNLAEKAGDTKTAASGYASLAYLAGILGLGRLAARWWRRCSESNDSRARASGLIGQALFAFGNCHWEECETRVLEAIRLCERTADAFSLESALTVRLYQLHHTGHFAESLRVGERILNSALSRKSRQREVWGRLAMVSDLLMFDELESAHDHLKETEAILEEADEVSRLSFFSLRLQLLVRERRWDDVDLEITQLRQRVESVSPMSYSCAPVFAALGEAAAVRWSLAADRGEDGTRFREPLQASLKLLKRSAKTFPFVRPSLRILQGTFLRLSGQEGNAVREWRAAAELADSLGTPLEAAVARERLAESKQISEEQRAAFRERSETLHREMLRRSEETRVSDNCD